MITFYVLRNKEKQNVYCRRFLSKVFVLLLITTINRFCVESSRKLSDVSFLILNRNDIRSYDRIKKMIAIDMFKNFLRAPLATLIWKIPKKSQFDNILQKISENPRVDGLSQEIDDITLTKILLILKIARYYPNKFYQKKTKK